MAAGTRDLNLEQGATHRFALQWMQPTEPKTPYDITGAEARMQIRTSDGALVLDLATDSGITLEPTTGTIRILITAEDSWQLTMAKAKYDLFLLLPGGDVVRLLKGKIAVDPAVTDYRDALAVTPSGEPVLTRALPRTTSPVVREMSAQVVGPTWSRTVPL